MFRREISAFVAASVEVLRTGAEGGLWAVLAGSLVMLAFMPGTLRADDEAVATDYGAAAPAYAAPASQPTVPQADAPPSPPAAPSKVVPAPNYPATPAVPVPYYAPAPYPATTPPYVAGQPAPGVPASPYSPAPANPSRPAPNFAPAPVIPQAPPRPPQLGTLSSAVLEILNDEGESIEELADMAKELIQTNDLASARCAVLLLVQATDRTKRLYELKGQLEREEIERHLHALQSELNAARRPMARHPQAAAPQIMLKIKIADVAQEDWTEVSQALRPVGEARIGQLGESTLLPARSYGIKSLERRKLLHITAAPNLVTVSGRPAHLAMDASGSALVIDAVPELTSSGTIRTEIRIQGTRQTDDSQRQIFEVDTDLEMKPGETAVLGGGALGEGADGQRLILLTAELVDKSPPADAEGAPRRR